MSDSEGYAAVADAETRPPADQVGKPRRPGLRRAGPGGSTPSAEETGAPEASRTEHRLAETPSASPAPPSRPSPPRRSWARRLRWPLLIGIPVAAVAVGLFLYLGGGRYVATDDAYLQAARVQISSNIAGRVVEVAVRENQAVHAGDLLFRLDPRDYETAAAQAEAQVAGSRQSRQGLQAALAQRAAEVQAAQTTLAFQEKELARQRALTAAGVNSQQQTDAQAHAVDVARAQVLIAQKAQATAAAALGGPEGGSVDSDPNIRQARAALERARLSQSYTVVRAPSDGLVTKVEQLQVGSYINAAQPLFTLVSPRVWVEANFKENQLTYMRPGQAATFKMDAYPGVEFTGRVESLSPGTGSSFSVLPPENASGNWVKVVQRLPVRLSIANNHPELPLHAGLSVKASVDTQHKRTLFGEKAGAQHLRRGRA